MTRAEEARATGVTRATLRRREAKAGLPPRRPGAIGRPVESRREALTEAIASGMTLSAIAERCGATTAAVSGWIAALGLPAPRKPEPQGLRRVPDAFAQAEAMLAEGLGVAEICRRLGCSTTAFYDHARRRGWRPNREDPHEARRARLTAALEEGLEIGEIADRMGLSESATRRSLAALGLRVPRRRRFATDGKVRAAADLLAEGLTTREIRRRLKVSGDVMCEARERWRARIADETDDEDADADEAESRIRRERSNAEFLAALAAERGVAIPSPRPSPRGGEGGGVPLTPALSPGGRGREAAR